MDEGDGPEPEEARIGDLAAFFLAGAAPLGALIALLRLKGQLQDEDIVTVREMAESTIRDRLLRGGRPDLADGLAAEAGRWIDLAREGGGERNEPPPSGGEG